MCIEPFRCDRDPVCMVSYIELHIVLPGWGLLYFRKLAFFGPEILRYQMKSIYKSFTWGVKLGERGQLKRVINSVKIKVQMKKCQS